MHWKSGINLRNDDAQDSTQSTGKGHARAVFLPPIAELEEAFDALEEFMKKSKRNK